MHILIQHFSTLAQAGSWVVFLALIGVAIWRAPWSFLKKSNSSNILLGMIVAVMVVWMMKAGLVPGLTIHLLGAALLTLMFGWEFSIMGITLVVIAHTINDGTSLMALPLEVILLGMLPSFVSYTIFRLVDTRLPNNFFIYIFLVAFFGAAISAAATVFATTGVQVASGAYKFDYVWHDYTRYALLIMFPEGFITGMLMSLFIAYRPEWVKTFDDSRYLDGK